MPQPRQRRRPLVRAKRQRLSTQQQRQRTQIRAWERLPKMQRHQRPHRAMKALALKKLEIRRADTRFTEPVTSRISHTTIDSRNAYQQSLWWSQVLGMR